MARNEQLIRQHKLLQILEHTRFGKTLNEIRDELVDELGLSSLHTRSVRRDLEALQAAGFHVICEEVQRGRVWKLGPAVRGTHKIAASATELMALSVGRDLLVPLAGTPFWSGIESFWHRIQEALPAGVWRHYEKYRQVLYVLGTPAKSYVQHKGILQTINRAIMEHRVVEIEYRSLNDPMAARRRIKPYGIALYQSSLYIIADTGEGDTAEAAMRHLKLDRFGKATALDEWFRPRRDLDVRRQLQEGMGIFSGGRPRNFRVRISARAARWVREDPWHPEQMIQEQPDGGILLTVKAAHEMELIPRVLALGAEAEIVAPASCRKACARIVARMSQLYRH